MEVETIFLAALQSSFLLGLIHGVNPCGHSWLVLAPFVTGEREGRRVALLTIAFLSGTGLACLVLGATLGSVSSLLPPTASFWVDIVSSIVLIVLGVLLLYDPEILHHHDDHSHHHAHHHAEVHDDHDHQHAPAHSHGGRSCAIAAVTEKGRWLAPTLFGIGFVNMVVPCPTAAVMYGYAIKSGSALSATLVFGVYALATAIAVGGVIYLIYRVTTLAGTMQKEWIEPLIMRSAGVIIIIFSVYGLYNTLVVG